LEAGIRAGVAPQAGQEAKKVNAADVRGRARHNSDKQTELQTDLQAYKHTGRSRNREGDHVKVEVQVHSVVIA
jgi:hypothetical protein